MKKIAISITCFLFAGLALAHGGGMNAHGCHLKAGKEHCHLKTAEAKRLQKLHSDVCGQQSPEGYFPKKDLYGRRCNAR